MTGYTDDLKYTREKWLHFVPKISKRRGYKSANKANV